MKKTVMIALGGNALSPKNEAGTIQQQFKLTLEDVADISSVTKE